jgi:hypothetical protein
MPKSEKNTWTCNWLDLETVGSWRLLSKLSPDAGCIRDAHDQDQSQWIPQHSFTVTLSGAPAWLQNWKVPECFSCEISCYFIFGESEILQSWCRGMRAPPPVQQMQISRRLTFTRWLIEALGPPGCWGMWPCCGHSQLQTIFWLLGWIQVAIPSHFIYARI